MQGTLWNHATFTKGLRFGMSAEHGTRGPDRLKPEYLKLTFTIVKIILLLMLRIAIFNSTLKLKL